MQPQSGDKALPKQRRTTQPQPKKQSTPTTTADPALKQSCALPFLLQIALVAVAELLEHAGDAAGLHVEAHEV